jgi:hypothetical protein
MEREQIIQKNKQITNAILVSQMQDHKGFKIFMDDINEVEKVYQFRDIRDVKSLDDLNYAKGYVQALEEMKNYFESQKHFALLPMTDPDTGDEEVLNKKEE